MSSSFYFTFVCRCATFNNLAFACFSLCRKHQFSSMAPFGVRIDDDAMSKPSFKWRRVLLKVSGEALAGDQAQNIDPKVRWKSSLILCALRTL